MSEGMLGKLPLSVVRGPRNDLDEKLAGEQGPMWITALKMLLRRENPWGIPAAIKITTDGRSGAVFVVTLKTQGRLMGEDAERMFLSDAFVASDGITYTLAVIRGDEFEDDRRTNTNIRFLADGLGCLAPPMGLAPYLQAYFSNEDLERMGIKTLVLMHPPASGSDRGPRLFGINRGCAGLWITSYNGESYFKWNREVLFFFLAPTL
jgi:hypothetical protein